MYCWGYNGYGEVGNNSTTNAATPQLVATDFASTIVAGEYSTCATELNGSVACWGNNAYGQLGVGNTTSQSSRRKASSA